MFSYAAGGGHLQDRDQQRVIVYSFGPNRRRDGTAEATDGADVGATGVLRGDAAR